MNLNVIKDAAVVSILPATEKDEQLQLLQLRIKENLNSLPGLVKLTRLKVWDVGNDLKEVRSLLKEGWIEFLKSFDLSQRTLYNYIQVAESFTREEVEALPINVTGLIELAQPSTPVDAIASVKASPKTLTTGQVKQTIQDFKTPITPREVSDHYGLIGDVFTPKWGELITLYEQIGKVKVAKNSKGEITKFSVERDDLGAPFPMVIRDRRGGWLAWQRDAAKWLNLVCSKPEMGVLEAPTPVPVEMVFQVGDRIAPYWNPDQEMRVVSVSDRGLYEARGEDQTVLYLNEEMAIAFGKEPSDENHSEPVPTIEPITTIIDVPAFEPEPRPVYTSAGNCDQYTPEHLWAVGLKCLGIEKFDLDPASYVGSPIPAKKIFTKADDGLKHEWKARSLWLNPPYSDRTEDGTLIETMPLWTEKLRLEYESGNTASAIYLVKADCGVGWFQDCLQSAVGVCFIKGRVKFDRPEGLEPNKSGAFFSSVLFYFGDDYDRFDYEASEVGVCVPLVRDF